MPRISIDLGTSVRTLAEAKMNTAEDALDLVAWTTTEAGRYGERYPSTRRPRSSPTRNNTIATTNSTWTNEPMV